MKFLDLVCLVFLILPTIFTKALKPSKILKAINCGSKEGTIKSDGDFKYEHVYNF